MRIRADIFFGTASHDFSYPFMPLITAPITIGNGVWIGAQAFICPEVTIGEGAIIGEMDQVRNINKKTKKESVGNHAFFFSIETI